MAPAQAQVAPLPGTQPTSVQPLPRAGDGALGQPGELIVEKGAPTVRPFFVATCQSVSTLLL
jgi:hypothetical protein